MATIDNVPDAEPPPDGTGDATPRPSFSVDLGRSLTRSEERYAPAPAPAFGGVYPGLVSDLADPNGQGRVLVRLPWLDDAGDGHYEVWARLATLMAGPDRGTWLVPDVDDEVLVAFEAGDPARPYVIGALWNGRDAPPETMDGDSENNLKTIKSRNGVRITLDDTSGQEQVIIETPGGQSLVMEDGSGSIEVEDSHGNSVKLESSGVTVNASAKVTVNGSLIELSASQVTISAGMVKATGVLQADTLIANSVVSASYTPGAGNIW